MTRTPVERAAATLLLVAWLLGGCGRIDYDGSQGGDAGGIDAGPSRDAEPDAPPFDAGPDATVTDAGPDGSVDAAPPDGGPPSCLPWPTDPVFDTPVPLTALNSPQSEAQPRLSADGLELFFASNRSGTWDLYVATRASTADPFTTFRSLDEINTSVQDVSLALAPDGTTAYIASGSGASGTGADIYVTTRSGPGALFSTPTLVSELSSTMEDYDPFVASDDATMYLSRIAVSGGDQRIYVSHRATAADAWGSPTMLSLLPAATQVDNPALSPDQLLIVFSASIGTDPRDLYFATRADPGAAFHTPLLLTSLDTTSKDTEPFVTPDGCTVYFASDRPGGLGANDLYVTRATW